MSDIKNLTNAVECILKATEMLDEKTTYTNEGLGHLVAAMRDLESRFQINLEKQEIRIAHLELKLGTHPRVH